jgi:predicted O-methyltransferase YrrM
MIYSFKNKDGRDIQGWFSDDEASVLFECASKAPLNRILELGSFVGKSAVVLSSALNKNGTLICVDFFSKNHVFKTNTENEIVADTLVSFWNNVTERGLENKILTLKGNYNNILPTLEGRFGMIFIDGGHLIQDRCLPQNGLGNI